MYIYKNSINYLTIKDFHDKYEKINLERYLTNYIAKSALFVNKASQIEFNIIKLKHDSKTSPIDLFRGSKSNIKTLFFIIIKSIT